MYSESRSPSYINPAELDAYLANGWYRMHETIFTAHFLTHQNELRTAIWLRNRLSDFNNQSTTFQKLAKRNRQFRVEFTPLQITKAHEKLFQEYRKAQFEDENDSLQRSLFGNNNNEAPYDSYMINLYDGRILIGSGVYDKGYASMAGIVSFYNVNYSKYSLGKYLIYLKMNQAKNWGLTFFYPGYFMPGVPRFDYKLSIGSECLEYLELSTFSWKSIHEFDDTKNPLRQLFQALKLLQQKLNDTGLNARILKLAVFDIGLIMPGIDGCMDSPVYLWTGLKIFGKREVVVVYSIQSAQYILFHTDPVEEDFYHHLDSAIYTN